MLRLSCAGGGRGQKWSNFIKRRVALHSNKGENSVLLHQCDGAALWLTVGSTHTCTHTHTHTLHFSVVLLAAGSTYTYAHGHTFLRSVRRVSKRKHLTIIARLLTISVVQSMVHICLFCCFLDAYIQTNIINTRPFVKRCTVMLSSPIRKTRKTGA